VEYGVNKEGDVVQWIFSKGFVEANDRYHSTDHHED